MTGWESKTIKPMSIPPDTSTLFNYINHVLKRSYDGKVKAKWDKRNKLVFLEIDHLPEEELESIVARLKRLYPNEFNEADL